MPRSDDDRVGPDKRCTQCKGFIIGKPVVVAGVEYCSSDCAIDEYQERKGKGRKGEER